jgi:hypothetical protein
VPDARVELVRDNAVVFSAVTNQSGGFRIAKASGHYLLRVTSARFSPAAREIDVDFDVADAVNKRNLYVLLGPEICAESCSTVTADKSEFRSIVRRTNAHGR